MTILNLYAGIGGNRKLWGDDHQITAVEYKPEIAAIYRDLFPRDTVIVADAHQYLLDNYRQFDFIWSSPPCPSHSRARFPNSRGTGAYAERQPPLYPDMRLYQEIIFLKHYFSGKWCVENVIAYYDPLIRPQQFGGHWFWVNFQMPPFGIAGNTDRAHATNLNGLQTRKGIDLAKYRHKDKRLLLRNCVEPELGKHILDWAIKPWEPNLKLAI
jgi:DNA (cytosine-5)-methyltransferase 1